MAQHIPTTALTSKIFRKIEKSIHNDFKNPYIKGSLKYELLERLVGQHNIGDYQQDPNDEIYLTNRYIGRGIVFGDTHGSFEIHFDKAKRKVSQIYLVA